MINQNFKSILDFRDVESLNLYEELCHTMKKDSKICKRLAWFKRSCQDAYAVEQWAICGIFRRKALDYDG